LQKHALQVAVEELEGIPVLRAAGELDLATIPELRVVFNEITDQSPRAIIFDFAGITYLDSSGLGILVSAKRRLGGHGGEVIVISNASCVLKALALSGLDQIIRVFQTEQEFREARVPS
jgi:anti-sigma B factor antagonist